MGEHAVTPLEFFVDLVFVFAITPPAVALCGGAARYLLGHVAFLYARRAGSSGAGRSERDCCSR